MDWRRLTKIYTVLAAPLGWAFLTVFVALAYHYGDWQITLLFNRYGEGFPELVLIPAMLVTSVIGGYFLLKDRHI